MGHTKLIKSYEAREIYLQPKLSSITTAAILLMQHLLQLLSLLLFYRVRHQGSSNTVLALLAVGLSFMLCQMPVYVDI